MHLLLAICLILLSKKKHYTLDDYREYATMLDSVRRLLPYPKSGFMQKIIQQIYAWIDLQTAIITQLALNDFLEAGRI